MGISFNAASLLSGNGIDVNSIVNEVLNQKNGQLSVWKQQQTDLQSQAADLGTINGALTALVSSVNSLTDVLGPLDAKVVSSSDSGIVGGSAQTSATAGNHQIIVNSLATVGTVFTDSVADPNASILPGGSTSGDLQLEIGGANGTTHDIAITQGSNDTLNTLATYINDQNWGVMASVVTDANGSRLAISSQSSGSAGALAIVNNTTSLNFDAPIGGTNASLSVDGIPFNSAKQYGHRSNTRCHLESRHGIAGRTGTAYSRRRRDAGNKRNQYVRQLLQHTDWVSQPGVHSGSHDKHGR